MGRPRVTPLLEGLSQTRSDGMSACESACMKKSGRRGGGSGTCGPGVTANARTAILQGSPRITAHWLQCKAKAAASARTRGKNGRVRGGGGEEEEEEEEEEKLRIEFKWLK